MQGEEAATNHKSNHVFAKRMSARLSPTALAEVTRLVAEIQRVFTTHKESTRGRMFALTTAMTPVRTRET